MRLWPLSSSRNSWPFHSAGLWAVLTAIVVTQMSLGGSLRATIEYFVGTFGGAVYAGAIAALVPHQTEISTLAVLALAVAPLALLAAINPNFRVGPFTAVIVVLGATATHTDPISSAFYRVLEVALGGFIGLLVSFLVLPARAHVLVIAAAARMLNLLADALPVLFAGFTQVVDVEADPTAPDRSWRRVRAHRRSRRRRQTRTGDVTSWRTWTRGHCCAPCSACATTSSSSRAPPPFHFPSNSVPGSDHRLRISLRQRRLICAPAQRRLSGGAGLLHWTRSMQRSVHLALWIDDARRHRLMRDLPSDTVERVFALGFALEQLRQNFIDLARCATEFAQLGITSIAK